MICVLGERRDGSLRGTAFYLNRAARAGGLPGIGSELAGISSGKDPDQLAVERALIVESSPVGRARGGDLACQPRGDVAREPPVYHLFFVIEPDVRNEQACEQARLLPAQGWERSGKFFVAKDRKRALAPLAPLAQLSIPPRSSRYPPAFIGSRAPSAAMIGRRPGAMLSTCRMSCRASSYRWHRQRAIARFRR